MPPKKSKATKNNDKNQSKQDDWKMHDLYEPGVSFNRIVTRSQTGFNRIKNTNSDLDLFSDLKRHQSSGVHVLEILKGKNGAIPRTIITRSTAKYLTISDELCKMLDVQYKGKGEDA